MSDGVIKANFGVNQVIAEKELPDVTIEDAGRVATVSNEGKWVADNVPTELPSVTAEDNDSVLTVVNGAWDKAAAGGDSDVFIVNFTNAHGDGIPYDSVVGDKTLSEINSAMTANKIVRAKRGIMYYNLVACQVIGSGNGTCTFVGVSGLNGSSDTTAWVNFYVWDSALQVFVPKSAQLSLS